MHLGNLFTALMSWLSARSRGDKWILRIEDLDPQRSKRDFALMIEDDLDWLGLRPDEGGIRRGGSCGPYLQSERSSLYEEALTGLKAIGMAYPCSCTRADIMATQAPHLSDGRVIYAGTCRPASLPAPYREPQKPCSVRIFVPDETIAFDDEICGPTEVNLARECGDFVLRRADGAWAYQLAVVVDDALMGVTEVVRGNDLLHSSAQQIYLYRLLGYEPPRFAHVPLICNASGLRLSKRDSSLSMEALRSRYTAPEIIGRLAWMAGLISKPYPCRPEELIPLFSLGALPAGEKIIASC